MRIATLMAAGLETALAQLLKQHPSKHPLAQWQGQVVQLELTELKTPLYLIMRDPIQVYSRYEAAPQARLALSMATLVQLRQGDSLSDLVKQGALTLEGDAALAGKLAQLLGAIEPDFAAPLSHLVGDAMAHRIDQFGKSLFAFGQQQSSRLAQHGALVAREELRLAPGGAEMADFSDEVEQLAQRVIRLQQRIEQREAKS